MKMIVNVVAIVLLWCGGPVLAMVEQMAAVKEMYGLTDDCDARTIAEMESLRPNFLTRFKIPHTKEVIQRLLVLQKEGVRSPHGVCVAPLDLDDARQILHIERLCKGAWQQERVASKKQRLAQEKYNLTWVLTYGDAPLFEKYFEQEIKDPNYMVLPNLTLLGRLCREHLDFKTSITRLQYLLARGAQTEQRCAIEHVGNDGQKTQDLATPLEILCIPEYCDDERKIEQVSKVKALLDAGAFVTPHSILWAQERAKNEQLAQALRTARCKDKKIVCEKKED